MGCSSGGEDYQSEGKPSPGTALLIMSSFAQSFVIPVGNCLQLVDCRSTALQKQAKSAGGNLSIQAIGGKEALQLRLPGLRTTYIC